MQESESDIIDKKSNQSESKNEEVTNRNQDHSDISSEKNHSNASKTYIQNDAVNKDSNSSNESNNLGTIGKKEIRNKNKIIIIVLAISPIIIYLLVFIYLYINNKSVDEQDCNKIQKNIEDLAETGSDISLLDVNKFKVRI